MSLLKSSPSLTLFRGFRVQNEYVWSPFVNKLEARLRFDGLPYKAEAGAIPSAPRGKIPYMTISKTKIEEDGQHQHEAETIGDSGLIISKLMEDGLLSDLNGSLSVEDRVKDMALRALLEDKLYFFSVRFSFSFSYFQNFSRLWLLCHPRPSSHIQPKTLTSCLHPELIQSPGLRALA